MNVLYAYSTLPPTAAQEDLAAYRDLPVPARSHPATGRVRRVQEARESVWTLHLLQQVTEVVSRTSFELAAHLGTLVA